MKKINKILIANRGEIACRIIYACKELGIKTVAVYSEVDRKSLHVELADESVFIGNSPAKDSYLVIDKIIKVAKETNSDAIHPGYGFLSENPEFNIEVRKSGLIFIGPEVEPMRILGSKVESRKLMIASDVPVVPGMKTSSKDLDEFVETASRIGYPVLIKASAGGGGKGMRVVHSAEDIKTSAEAAMRESLSAFGSDEIFLEKYIENPRHIEIQVAADHYGNAIHLFERECSIQRRHQKIIEESPSTALSDETRKQMCETAVRAIKAANYDSVATVEFLLAQNGEFYFLEVNTRIQVEHPITEMVTGIDLMKLQIGIAEGKKLPYNQSEITQKGHSIECRIYAEDGDNNFMPSSGKILKYIEPKGKGIRYDTGVKEGSEVTVFYDPILAKLITYGENREEARIKMINSLKENVILGVKTSTAFMLKVLENEDFIAGITYTNFIESHSKMLDNKNEFLNNALALSAFAIDNNKTNKVSNHNYLKDNNPWQSIGKWEIGGTI
jgi:acetyl-CoA carboxylase biotin carboxylase subunit